MPSRPVNIYTEKGIKPFELYPKAQDKTIKNETDTRIKPFIMNKFGDDILDKVR